MTSGAVLPAAGFAVGILMGLTGVGSGALIAPMLLFAGVNPAIVVGSDLAFALVTKLAGVGLHLRHGTIQWSWVRRLAWGSVPGVLVGSLLVSRAINSPEFLRALVGCVLMLSAGIALVLGILRSKTSDLPTALSAPSAHTVAAAGLAVGVLVGATSVGSGSLVDIALILFSNLGGAQLVGTGLAHAVLLSAVASAVHWRMGTVDVGIVAALLAGSIPGIVLGTRLARRTAPARLRWLVAALVFTSGATLLSQVAIR